MMRTIQTFLLRLLSNSEEPQALRGVIYAVSNGEEQTFADGPALLALLHQMARSAPRVHDPQASCDPPSKPQVQKGGTSDET